MIKAGAVIGTLRQRTLAGCLTPVLWQNCHVLDDKDPPPSCVGGDSSANNGSRQKSQGIRDGNIRHSLCVLLWWHEVKDHDCAKGEASATADALESSKDNASECQSAIFDYYVGIVPYSCVNVWAAAQPAENMMKIAVDSKKRGFRPKMSLNLAKITMTAAAGRKL